MDIYQRSLKSLEWERLVLALAGLAETSSGRQRLVILLPEAAPGELLLANLLLNQTKEALDLINARAYPSLAGLEISTDTLSVLAIGGALSIHELLAALKLLRISRTVKNSLVLLDKTSFPCLHPFAARFVALPHLERDLSDALELDGTVKDEASPVLRRLRREARELGVKVKEELKRIINNLSGSKALQEDLYTMRNGRYVLPVNANQRHQVDGIVHDASHTGLTIFVEPLPVMELSNQIRIKEAEIESEIERILLVLTESLRPHSDALKDSLEAAIELDCIFARARLARIMDGERPELAAEPTIDLKSAKHPLLLLQNQTEGKKRPVIANSVTIAGGSSSARSLVITGPNTGGKTVLLKLIGLCALMVRCGLLPPVARGSSISLFEVSADIGDDQSIAESLSTFSSHIKNIVEILDGATSKSLVLLDEVGAGTDPKEGAALSQAILEDLAHKGACVVATTHLGELKTLAYTNQSFINGSFEFDMDELSPTYKLRLGVPGSSKATEVATRLGLDKTVIGRASELASASKNMLDDVVASLTAKLAQVSSLEEQLAEEKTAIEKLKAEFEKDKAELKSKREAILAEQKAELQKEYGAARDLIKETVAALQKEPGLKKAEVARRQLEELRQELAWDKPLKGQTKAKEELWTVGMKVRVQALNRLGEVQEVLKDSRGKVEGLMVQMGVLKIKVKPDELDLLGGEDKSQYKAHKRKKERVVSNFASTEGTSVFVRSQANTLDLRGKRVDEAMGLLEGFVDSCVLGRISPFMVIHGHGTGALKSVVREFLSGNRYPIEFRPGETYEGGDGVSVVELTN